MRLIRARLQEELGHVFDHGQIVCVELAGYGRTLRVVACQESFTEAGNYRHRLIRQLVHHALPFSLVDAVGEDLHCCGPYALLSGPLLQARAFELLTIDLGSLVRLFE